MVGKPCAFAGTRKIGRLRSVRAVAVGLVPLSALPPTTKGVLWNCEEGNVVGLRKAQALAPGVAYAAPAEPRTRPSLGPETRARLSALDSLASHVETRRLESEVSRPVGYRRSGKPAHAGGTGHGAPSDGRMRGSPRVTARRTAAGNRRMRRGRAWHVRRGRWSWPSSLRGIEGSSSVPVRREQLQKLAGSLWSRMSSRAAPRKGWRRE